MKKISVVIPTYNEEENIREMIESVENQFKQHLHNYDYEIKCIDNASEDNTKKILEEISSNNIKVKVRC